MLRVLVAEHPENPAFSMALEEALYISLSRLGGPPVLRFWRHRSAVILGYFQKAEEEVDLDEARRLRVDVVRRFTGGGAVYHDIGCLVWSVITKGPPDGGLGFVYGRLLEGFVRALRRFADARVENVNDVVVAGRKVSGTSATMDRRGSYLLHGTLLVDTDLSMIPRLLNVPREKLLDKGVSDVKYRVGNLSELTGKRIEMRDLMREIVRSYSELLGLEPVLDVPTKLEYTIAARLYEEKYSKEEWNLQRKKVDVRLDDILRAQTGP